MIFHNLHHRLTVFLSVYCSQGLELCLGKEGNTYFSLSISLLEGQIARLDMDEGLAQVKILLISPLCWAFRCECRR